MFEKTTWRPRTAKIRLRIVVILRYGRVFRRDRVHLAVGLDAVNLVTGARPPG